MPQTPPPQTPDQPTAPDQQKAPWGDPPGDAAWKALRFSGAFMAFGGLVLTIIALAQGDAVTWTSMGPVFIQIGAVGIIAAYLWKASLARTERRKAAEAREETEGEATPRPPRG
ncbi:MAG: hypothetical protein Q4G21_06785 [Dermabacter sp.]|nr:hypothetical protein [Dermabacter sp.]